MTLKNFLAFAAVVAAFFGLYLLLAPMTFLQQNGVEASAGAALMAQSVGCTLLGLAVINWLARKDVNSPVTWGVVWGNIVVHGLGLIVDLMGGANGVYTKNAFVGPVVHIIFIVGFGYFVLRRPKAATPAGG